MNDEKMTELLQAVLDVLHALNRGEASMKVESLLYRVVDQANYAGLPLYLRDNDPQD